MHQSILIIDFGSQYTQLIARRIRELQVYCEIVPCTHIPPIADSVRGIILSGSPFSVRDPKALSTDIHALARQRPLLGICYGAQMIAAQTGGEVAPSEKREYGRAILRPLSDKEPVLENLGNQNQVWMSHADTILRLSDAFEIIASTESIEVAAFRNRNGSFPHPVLGFQFHPEVTHSTGGLTLLKNFVHNICGCQPDWTAASFIEESISKIRETIGQEVVILGLSGGVDSTVAAELLHRAIGDQLHGVFVNNGLLRKDEFQQVLDSYRTMGIKVTGVDASDEFLNALEGISDPEKKRKTIGKIFIDVFEREAKRDKEARWLAQGTIYPDVIESVSVHGPSATIKSHHNVGGLPEKLNLKVIEPLRNLFKDEVREVGRALQIPTNILNRHPFPGPGLSIRLLGAISREKLLILQEADAIFINSLKEFDLYSKVWQAGVMLLPVQSVGVMGDERTYEYVVALRAVTSHDGMTADWAHLPYEFLALVSNRIINQVKGVNRVVYDISSKPPATIEWE